MDRTLGNYTIMRMVGSLEIKGEGVNAMTKVVAGIISVSDQATLATMPLPGLQLAADWFWHRMFYADAAALPVTSIPIDNRSMRKTPELNRNWWFLVGNFSASADLTFGVYLRILLQFA